MDDICMARSRGAGRALPAEKIPVRCCAVAVRPAGGKTASYIPQGGREVKKNEEMERNFRSPLFQSGEQVPAKTVRGTYGTGVSTTDFVSAPLVIPLTVRVHFPGGSVMVPGEYLTNRDQPPVPGKVNSVNWPLTE